MKMLRIVMVVMVFLVLCSAQFANAGGVATTVKLGTLGYGADVTLGLSRHLNFRVGYNMFNYDADLSSYDEDSGLDNIQLEIDWETISASFDLYPGASEFRITAGVIVNNNEIRLTADSGDDVEINDISYRVADLQGLVTFEQLAPYLGIGYGNAVADDGRWGFSMDFGVMFQGAPDVDLSAHVLDDRQADLDASIEEEEKNIEDDISVLNLYLVLSFGVSFRF